MAEDVVLARVGALRRCISRLQRARIKAATTTSALIQRTGRPQFAVIGCYNTSNIGDLAMGMVVREALRSRDRRAALQSFTARPPFPKARFTIAGGGGILTAHATSPLRTILAIHGRRPEAVALLGLSGELWPEECPGDLAAFLRAVPFISLRSRRERDRLAELLGRDDIIAHADLAFALPKACGTGTLAAPPTGRILGMNVTPQLMSMRGASWVPGTTPSPWYRRHFPELVEFYPQIGMRYVSVVRGIARGYRDREWKVICIPFALEDDLFSRAVFGKGEVAFAPYRHDPADALKQVASCSAFCATRFHSHVFALAARVPLISIAYAPKCVDLWTELALPGNACATIAEVARAPHAAQDKLLAAEPTLPLGRVADRQASSAWEACLSCVRALSKSEATG